MKGMDIYKRIMKDKGFEADMVPEDEEISFISTGIITLNLLFSGKVGGGIPKGKISMISAPSALGKTFVGYNVLKNAQKEGMYTIVLDTERSFDHNFAQKVGIDTSPEKFVAIQQNSIEELQQRVLTILEGMDREEKKNIFFLLDSFGGLVTTKTLNDAAANKDVVDMTESKKKNKFSKIMMNTGATFLVVNHVYDNVGGFGDPMSIPGGRGIFFASSCIVLGQSKAKDKTADAITGAIVSCVTKKSRFGKEHSKLKFRIKVKGGLDVFFGLLPDALEAGVVTKSGTGFYTRPCVKDDKKWREKDIYTSDFWLPVFNETEFTEHLEAKYSFKNEDIDLKEDIRETLAKEDA